MKDDSLIEALGKIDGDTVSIKQDERGSVLFFEHGINGLHVASVKPGAVRGNHVHDQDETICIIAGNGICEIELEEMQTGLKEKIQVNRAMKVFRIKAGVKHSVRNIGEREFYLVCFLT